MFLHSGASLHGHEFSPINTPTIRRSPLVRSAFSVPPPKLSTYDSTKPTVTQTPRRPSAENRRTSDRVSFSEPEVEIMSDDGLSYASEGSDATAGGTKKKRRKATRTSTRYQLAHPAPTLTRQQKLLRIRPKLLLQLQRFSSDIRPLPCIDVLPSIVVVPRLMKRFPRMFKGKGELGANDVLIVKSEDYGTPDTDADGDLDDESCGNREVLAVICQIRGLPGSSEICLADGSIWYGTPMPKGVFEFVTTDSSTGERTVARWVQRVSPRNHSSLPPTPMVGPNSPSDYKYLFSILHPNTRRHPILASITQKILDIPDNYTTVSSSSGRYPPTSPIRGSLVGWQPAPEEEESLDRTTLPIDDSTRTLIQITGLWLALQLGWCPYFKYENMPALTTTKSTPLALPSLSPGARAFSTSSTNDASKPLVLDTRASTPDSNSGSRNLGGGKIFRSGTQTFRSNPATTSPTLLDRNAPVPRRTVSTGTAFMQRAAARRAGNLPSTVASDSEGEAVPSLTGAVTSDVPMASFNRKSMPLPPAHFDASGNTTETPTRSFHRRVQSVFMPSTPLRSPMNGISGQEKNRTESSYDGPRKNIGASQQHIERRPGRWSALIKFLRRGEQSAR